MAGLCHQAAANCACVVHDEDSSLIKELLLFERACMQYRCLECSRSVDVAHNFGERTPQEHRTGDGSYTPCSGTLLLYAMLKLTHNAVDFSLLPPGVELDLTTISADVAYRVCVEAREQHFTSSSELSFSLGAKPALILGRAHVVEGMWLAEPSARTLWQHTVLLAEVAPCRASSAACRCWACTGPRRS